MSDPHRTPGDPPQTIDAEPTIPSPSPLPAPPEEQDEQVEEEGDILGGNFA